MNKGSFGLVYQNVLRNSNLSPSAKGLYAYLASFCGASDECFPSIETILKEMDFGKGTFYRHINALVDAGVVEKRQTKNGSRFGRTVYRITHETHVTDLPFTQNGDTTISTTHEKESNNNNIRTITSLKNNRDIDYQLVADNYNAICVSFPKLTKLSDKRKKTIKARINQGYTMEDFKRLFELAENSSFLKGKNNRNWSANFDWLVTDANMAKVLDGNYLDRREEKGSAENGTQSESSAKLW